MITNLHIRETDFEILRKANVTPFQHNLFNILEDWRVEERLSARYPGCRENFRYLIQKLFGTQKAGDTNPAFSILNTIFADGAFRGLWTRLSPRRIRWRRRWNAIIRDSERRWTGFSIG